MSTEGIPSSWRMITQRTNPTESSMRPTVNKARMSENPGLSLPTWTSFMLGQIRLSQLMQIESLREKQMKANDRALEQIPHIFQAGHETVVWKGK